MDVEPRVAPEPQTAEELSAQPRPKQRLAFAVFVAAGVAGLMLAADEFGLIHLSRRVALVAAIAVTLGLFAETVVFFRQKDKTDGD